MFYIETKKQTGRPPIDNPKDLRIFSRITKEDLKKLNYCVNNSNMNKSEVIRKGIDKVYQELKK